MAKGKPALCRDLGRILAERRRSNAAGKHRDTTPRSERKRQAIRDQLDTQVDA